MAQRLVATGNYKAAYLSKDDGATWVGSTLPGADNDVWTICGSGEIIVAVRRFDSTLAATSTMYATSTDGVTWTTRTLPALPVAGLVGAYFGKLIYNDNLFFLPVLSQSSTVDLVGSAYYTSPDGITWTARDTTPTYPVKGIRMVTGGAAGTNVLAVGANGQVFQSNPAALGALVHTATLPFSPTCDPVWHVDKWVIASDTSWSYSADGITWTTATAPWTTTRRLCSGYSDDFTYKRLYAVQDGSGSPTSYYGSSTGLSWTLYSSAISGYATPRYWRDAEGGALQATYVGDGGIVSRLHNYGTASFHKLTAPAPPSNPSLANASRIYHSVAYIPALLIQAEIGDDLGLSDSVVGASPVSASVDNAITVGSSMVGNPLLSAVTVDALLLMDAYARSTALEASIGASITVASANGVANADVQYAVNVITGALTEYAGFDFSAMAGSAGSTYGARASGVYRIRGGDDNGSPVSIHIDFGATDFAERVAKSLEAVYVGASTDGAMYIRVNADTRSDLYRVVQRDPISRAVTGKGIASRKWGVELDVYDATEFELDTIELLVGAASRRWSSR